MYENFLSSRENFFNKEKYDFLIQIVINILKKVIEEKYTQKNKLPSGKIYDFLSKKYLVNINTLVVRKVLLKELIFLIQILILSVILMQ